MRRVSYECSAEIGSVTQAMNAQKALSAAAIPSEIVKGESARAHSHGCVYSVSFPCPHTNNVRAVLMAANIKVRAWNDG